MSNNLKKAIRLSASEKSDIQIAANIIKDGGIIAFPFNGIFGLFGDLDNKEAAEKIIKAKNRPKDRKLIIVVEPENLDEVVDLDKIHYSRESLKNLLINVHALGIITPASTKAPIHLIEKGDLDTVLLIWTEYDPLRAIIKKFKELGGRAFVGTSANKSGQPTHYSTTTLWSDFEHDVDAIVEADFSQMDPIRRKSTTIIDLTNQTPRLHRLGNVDESELEAALKKSGLPKHIANQNIIVVQAKS